MKKWMPLFKGERKTQLLLGCLLVTSLYYCMFQFSKVKSNEKQLHAITIKINDFNSLRERLPTITTPASLLNENLRKSARENNIPVTEWTEIPEGIQAKLSAVSFERLILWLAKLQSKQGIIVTRLVIEAKEHHPGIVMVNQVTFIASQSIL